jgi:hypothetical protein
MVGVSYRSKKIEEPFNTDQAADDLMIAVVFRKSAVFCVSVFSFAKAM